MKRQKRNGQSEEYNYWQPATDMMTGIVFILMLIVALLSLYILNTYNSAMDEEEGNQSFSEEYTETEIRETETERETEPVTEPETDDDDDDNDDDDDGGGEGETETEKETERVTGGFGEEEWYKSAVLVKLVDAETDRTLQVAGIRFELYGADSGLKVLNTYYPEKISYREFETKEDGTFYLPEKIYEGTYYFRELDAPEGYDAADDTYFTVDDLYDWSSPYVVTIPVSPSKNIIRVQTTDKDTGEAVAGSTFQVLAAEDVMTLDGTVRYAKGEVADTIVCDEEGYGESKELYLGDYILQQDQIPEYYAGLSKTAKAEVAEDEGQEPELHEFSIEKTSFTVRLTDELNTSEPLSDVEFIVTADSDSVEAQIFRTDADGSFTVTDLEKGTSYHIREVTAPENYQTDATEHTVKVDAQGRIGGKAEAEVVLTNRMLRVSVSIVDRLLGSAVPDEKEVHLYDSAGAEVESWTYSGTAKTLEGLTEGTYSIAIGENTETRYEFRAEDTAEVQSWEIELITWRSIAAAAGAIAAAVLAIVLLIAGIRRLVRRRKKKKGQSVE